MTIGRNSKRNKAPRSPPFLDKANGFYGRLEEMGGDDVQVEGESKEEQTRTSTGGENRSSQDNMMAPSWIEEDDQVIDLNQGMMDDDGTTLLERKPSRLSRRWSRKSSRKAKFDKSSPGKESTKTDNKEVAPVAQTLEVTRVREAESEPVHFSVREHADDQVLISGQELEDPRKEKKTEGKLNGESMEAVKRNTLKNYRTAVDRAFRRGWETFITNLYSVTLTPISSTTSSSPTVKSKMNSNSVLAEFR